MKLPESAVLDCCHCGNRTPHKLTHQHTHPMLYDMTHDEEIHERHFWASYLCGTCGGLSLYGEFEYFFHLNNWSGARLYPKGSNLAPAGNTVSPSSPIPASILKLYSEVWPLRHRAPSAFVAQIRRLLEHICKNQGAKGKTLFVQLRHLVAKGTFPGYFSDITDLLRTVGNLGAHAGDKDLNIWDAELIDEFFRSIVDYVYIAPARIKRMKERMSATNEMPGD